MKHKPLYFVKDEADGPEWLANEGRALDSEFSRKAEVSELTVELLAGMLDQHAENCNLHDFVGLHKALALLLARQFSRKQVTRIFRTLVDLDGLAGMVGAMGFGNDSVNLEILGTAINSSKWSID